MTDTTWDRATPVDLEALPAIIKAHLAAHHGKDVDAELACYAETATVTDDNTPYTGPAMIRAWLERTANEFTYTAELTGAAKVDDRHWDVVRRLEGNFPGGVVDLHYRFSLADANAIVRLVIEA